jgi:Zn-dependent protease with chaperone function
MLHALIAALAIEALLRLWRARAPGDRLVSRLLGLCQPLLVTPALFLLAPQRAGDDFHDHLAVFASRHWDALQLAGVTALQAALALGAFLGTGLFLMDLVPLLSPRRRTLPPAAPAPDELRRALADVAASLGGRAPALHFVETGATALFCAGVRRPVLVVSRAALDILDEEELRAALGHELAHLRRHDPALSWALMVVRGLLFFNPVAQVIARALTRDAEWRADEGAGPDRLALASAVLKLHRAGTARARPIRPALPFAAALSEPLKRVRSHDVEARCRRLLEPAPPPAVAFRAMRLALASASIAALAFVVT